MNLKSRFAGQALYTLPFILNEIPRIARNDKTSDIHSLCHAELRRSISLYLLSLLSLLIGFTEIAFGDVFLLRYNVSSLLFGLRMACIAIHVGVAMALQILRPYGAWVIGRGSFFGGRRSWVAENDLTPAPLLKGEGLAAG